MNNWAVYPAATLETWARGVSPDPVAAEHEIAAYIKLMRGESDRAELRRIARVYGCVVEWDDDDSVQD